MGFIVNWKSMSNGHAKRHAYYASREWAILKQSVRSRSGGVCEHCKRAPGTQTHHQTYQRLYRERLEDLLHVCEPCHLFLSGKSTFDPRVISAKSLANQDDDEFYCESCIAGEYAARLFAMGILGNSYVRNGGYRYLYMAFELIDPCDPQLVRFMYAEKFAVPLDAGRGMILDEESYYALVVRGMIGGQIPPGTTYSISGLIGGEFKLSMSCTNSGYGVGEHRIGKIWPDSGFEPFFIHEPIDLFEPESFTGPDWLPSFEGQSVRSMIAEFSRHTGSVVA